MACDVREFSFRVKSVSTKDSGYVQSTTYFPVELEERERHTQRKKRRKKKERLLECDSSHEISKQICIKLSS